MHLPLLPQPFKLLATAMKISAAAALVGAS